MENWIDVNDRLPEINQEIIICEKGSNYVIAAVVSLKGNAYPLTDLYRSNSVDFTHWMPLPKPPNTTTPCN